MNYSAFGVDHGSISKADDINFQKNPKDFNKIFTLQDKQKLGKKPKNPVQKPLPKMPVTKAEKPPPSQDELRQRKKRSARLTIASSTLGIAGLAAMGGSRALPIVARNSSKLGPKLGSKKKYIPKKVKALSDPQKAKAAKDKGINAAWALSTGATGIGGIGGYNYAALQRAEARKKRI